MKKKGIKALRIGVTVLSLAGVVWFLLPIIKGGFGEGVIFGEFCCLTALFLGNFYGKFQKKAVKIIMSVLLVCFLAGLSWVGFLTVKINTATHSPEIPPGTTAIVLGARVYDDRPSLSLKGRLDVAVDYLKNDPTARCIVSGGQGADESRSEAAVEKEYLLALGIGSDRIFMEDRST
ncbi:MAG: YdcF family protein, partial [Oscillospiraceae bacterium]